MSVVELQSKYFPVQPRGRLEASAMSDDKLRNQAFLNGPNDGRNEEEKWKSLNQPRDLYSTASLHHMPKWPIECQVIPERIRHIETVVGKMEPFYSPSYTENQPKPVGEEMGQVIFDYQPKLSVEYFCRARAGGGENIDSFETDCNTLKFESRFESGNLGKVIKVTNVYYELYLRPDMYTDRHFQWFYFRIQNTKDNITYRFSIVNLTKPDSLYRYGLKPLMYSDKDAQLNSIGWTRCGQSISYYKNDVVDFVRIYRADDNNAFYTLTFNLKFRHNNDTVYIAQCYPYTYTNLQQHLADVEADENKSKLCQQRLLCKSLAGNNIYVLTITSPHTYFEESSKKPVVVISARVHPGETQSSYMMKGIIDFLTSNYSQAKELRDQFIFKLIPMLNPDGVIVGNSRCCLLGQDLNRQYRTVLREAFPQIYHTKVMLRRLMDENGIFLYCDLHGHSRRNNAFMYGCENKRVPEKKLTEQVFPLMMHKNASDKFSFQSCTFKVQKSKEGTGRVFAWTLGVGLSYTLEVSLGGSTMPSRQQSHFNTYDYEGIGRHFCETLLDYSDNSPSKERLRERILQRLIQCGSKAEEPLDISVTDYSSLSHSESEESCDEAEVNHRKPSLIRNPSIKSQNSTRSKHPLKPGKICLTAERAGATGVQMTTATAAVTVTVNRSTTGQACHNVDTGEVGNESNNIQSQLLQSQKEKDPKVMCDKKERGQKERQIKLRKGLKRVSFDAIPERQMPTNSSFISTKCSNILFDDPFKPPAPDSQRLSSARSQLGEAKDSIPAPMSNSNCEKVSWTLTLPCHPPIESPSLIEIIDDVALLQLVPRAEEDLDCTNSSGPVKSSKPTRLRSRLSSQDETNVQRGEKLFEALKQRTIRRNSLYALTDKSESSKKSEIADSRLSLNDICSQSNYSKKTTLTHLRAKFQQDRALLQEMPGYRFVCSESLNKQREIYGNGASNSSSTGTIHKHENHHKFKSKKLLKKSKSVGDKLDEVTYVRNLRSSDSIIPVKNSSLGTGTNNTKKKKLKRQKNLKH